MNQQDFKKIVLDWLHSEGLFPKKVRVYNSKKYGLEVRVYCPPMTYTSDRISFRTTHVEKVGDNGRRRHGTRGHHEITQATYIAVGEDVMKIEQTKGKPKSMWDMNERDLVLQQIKDSALL